MRRHSIALLQVCYLAALAATTAGEAGAGQLAKARSAVRREASAPAPAAPRPSGKLAAARNAVRQEAPAEQPPSHDGRRDRRRRYDGHSHGPSFCGGWSFAGPTFWSTPCHTTYMVEQPSVGQPSVYQPIAPSYAPAIPQPPTAPFTAELQRSFACFPYAPGSEGFLDKQPAPLMKPWLGAVRFEYGGDFDGLTRQGVSAQIEGGLGWALDFHWDSYRESLDGGGYDELHLGDVNAMYRVVETDHSLIRVGLGVNWLGDAYETNAGVNFTMKADFAPCRPFVISTELDLGTLGDAEMLHGAATLGVATERLELFGGYDYRRIGEAELQGPMIGLRVWF